MNFTLVKPPAHLADYVRFFWFLEGNATNKNPFAHRTLADPCPELIFYCKGRFTYTDLAKQGKQLSSGIFGQTQNFSKVMTHSDFNLFGIYLYPHALPRLFGLPASEVSNQSADIKTLCGKEGEILEEKIILAPNNNQRVKIAIAFFESRLKKAGTEYLNLIKSIRLISNSCGLTSVKTLAEEHFLSLRQFERKFKEFSGFSPKLFLRLVRFNSVVTKSFHDKSLTEISHEFGYYDQSHFIHDFQTFSGYNPKEYFRQGADTDYRATTEFKD